MNIMVMAPVGSDKVKAVLLENANPKYTFIKAVGIMYSYSAEDADGSCGDLVKYTKKLIAEKLGAGFNASVKPDGKAY